MKNRTRLIVLVVGIILIFGVLATALVRGFSYRRTNAGLSLGSATYNGVPVDTTTEHTETLPFESMDALDLNVRSAQVRLTPGSRYEVEYHFYGDLYTFQHRQEGNSLRIWDEMMPPPQGSSRGFFSLFGGTSGIVYTGHVKTNTIEVRYPKDAVFSSAKLKNAYGDIQADGLRAGTLEIRLQSGDADLREIYAGTLDIEDSYGDVTLKNSEDYTGQSAAFDLSSGGLEVQNLKTGRIKIKNSYGDVDLRDVTADALAIDMSSGDVNLKDVSGGETSIENSYGDIDGERFGAANLFIDASSGDIRLAGRYTGKTDIHASYGSVHVRDDSLRAADCPLDLKTSYGDIRLGGELLKDGDGDKLTHYRADASGPDSISIDCSSGDIVLNLAK